MKKKWIVILIIVSVLVAARLAMPYFVKKYVNKTLSELEGYTGSVKDIDIWLIRGAYVIDSLNIQKTGDSIPVPFVSIERTDLSVHWAALFKGSVSGEVVMTKPVVNFAVAGKDVSQDGSEADWLEALDDLIPIQINRFEIIDGKISYKDFTTTPKVDISLDSLQVVATNLSTVVDKTKALPSTIHATASSIGGGQLTTDMGLNVLKQVPDFDLDFSFENVDLTALNDFVKAYTKTDVERGVFSLYAEAAAKDGNLTGYVKPVIQDLQILDWEKEEEGFLRKMWEGVVDVFTDVFKNQKKDQLATQVPIEGDLNNPDTKIWPTVWNTLKNAFIQALSKRVEGEIDFFSNTDKNGDKK